MNLRDLPVFFLDLQTTGSHPKSAEVLEVAWGSTPQGFHCKLIRPESGFIPYRIQKITGISEQDLIDSHDKVEVVEELKKLQDQICIIHFAQFETPFLENWFENKIPFPIICTYEIARRLFPNLPTRSLKGIAGFFGHQKEDIKRSQAHVEATEVIWNGLVTELEKLEIKTYDQLKLWLAQDFKKKKAKYEYPLDKAIRLNLTKKPGIYRMLNRSGEVLYVGKATSLHSRVNSYFRGQKNRDSKKLEMLTQVWDIRTTECQSPLEAALLETDEIKKLNPPYNICLKVDNRNLAFFNHDFTNFSHTQDAEFSIGPFSHHMALDSLRNLSYSLKRGIFSSHIFYDPFPPELLEQGFNLFCTKQQVSSSQFGEVRSSIALGIKIWKKLKGTEANELIVPDEESESDDVDQSQDEDIETAIITAEDMAEKFERHFIRAGLAYLRARALTKLLNMEVHYPISKSSMHTLYFQNGQQVSVQEFQEKASQKLPNTKSLAWQNLTVQDYDRMSVLYAELSKLRDRHV